MTGRAFCSFGDDTGSGEAIVDLARISTFDSVPETDADYDMDNDIDGSDLLTWQRGFGIPSGATHGEGDANSDGTVDREDFDIWEQQFGNAPSLVTPFLAGAATAAIPEPSSMLLMYFVGLLMLLRSWFWRF